MPEQSEVLAITDEKSLLVLKNREPILYIPHGPYWRGDLCGCRVTDVCPQLGGVFVDFGAERLGFLPTDAPHERDELLLLMIDRLPVGEKGVRFTDRVTVAGTHLVYTPTRHYFGYSKKLENKRPLEDIFPKGHYGILRTKGALVTDEVLQREAQMLVEEYQALFPLKVGVLKQALPLEVAIRDYDHVLTSASLDEVQRSKAKFHKEVQVQYAEDVFSPYRTMLKGIHSQKVWLPSGGALTVEQTEVCATFDVNTAKCDRKDAKEKTNLEALSEIPRQMVLRGFNGRVLVDFVGEIPKGAEDFFRNRLGGLKQIGPTPSGLLEMILHQ